MSEWFVVVCEDDSTLFGYGESIEKAWRDAEEWIVDAVRDQVAAEILSAKKYGGSVCPDLTFRCHPATELLCVSVGEQGGHSNWHKRPDGVLELGPARPKESAT